MIGERYHPRVAIPRGEAFGSLERLLDELTLEGASMEGSRLGPPRELLAQYREDVERWRRDLRNNVITPDELPRLYGSYANSNSNYPRVARLFAGERRVLEAMGDGEYGARGWFGRQ